MKSRRLLITPLAETDLAQIWAYIAAGSPQNANNFVNKLQSKFPRLLNAPEIGPSRASLARGLHVLLYRKYAIYYVFDEQAVTIVRVVRGSRDRDVLF